MRRDRAIAPWRARRFAATRSRTPRRQCRGRSRLRPRRPQRRRRRRPSHSRSGRTRGVRRRRREQVRILQPAATPGRRNARTPARQSPGSSMISRLRRANQAAMAVSVPVAFDVMSDAPETEALPDRMASLTPSSPAAAAPAQPPPPRSAKKKEYDVGVDPSPPSKPAPSLCARLCCLFCCNLWLLLLILSALGPAIALSNSFPANEIDYWYSARVCPRHPGGGIPTYEQYSDLPSLPSELSCSAPTNRTTCHGSPCALMGCTHMETEESCKSCCGGMLQRHRAQCAFPFRSADEGDHAALHHQCIPDPSSYIIIRHRCRLVPYRGR